MSSENFEHQIDFILSQQAVFSSEMIELKESIAQLGTNVDKLASIVGSVVQQVNVVSQQVESVSQQMGSAIEEMRDGFNNLIIASEATRDLANKVASLEVQTSQRVTGLERRVTDLEEKQ